MGSTSQSAETFGGTPCSFCGRIPGSPAPACGHCGSSGGLPDGAAMRASDAVDLAAATAKAAYERGRADERRDIAAWLTPAKIEWMIHAFDLIDGLMVSKGLETSSEVQDDLRRLADLLAGDAPASGPSEYDRGAADALASARDAISSLIACQRPCIAALVAGDVAASGDALIPLPASIRDAIRNADMACLCGDPNSGRPCPSHPGGVS